MQKARANILDWLNSGRNESHSGVHPYSFSCLFPHLSFTAFSPDTTKHENHKALPMFLGISGQRENSLGWAGLALRKMGQRFLHKTVLYKVHVWYTYMSMICVNQNIFTMLIIHWCVCECVCMCVCVVCQKTILKILFISFHFISKIPWLKIVYSNWIALKWVYRDGFPSPCHPFHGSMSPVPWFHSRPQKFQQGSIGGQGDNPKTYLLRSHGETQWWTESVVR